MLCIDREVSLYRFFSNLHATVPREVPLSSRLVLLRLPPRVSLTGGFVASSRGAGPSAEARRPPGGAPPLCCSEDEDEGEPHTGAWGGAPPACCCSRKPRQGLRELLGAGGGARGRRRAVLLLCSTYFPMSNVLLSC
jgi:hypothetical protein